MSQSSGSSGSIGLGNTKARPNPARHWCFTWNRPIAADVRAFKILFEDVRLRQSRCVMELEVGENGTPHYQGYVQFHKKCRPMSVFNRPEFRVIHWEKCSTSQKDIEGANYRYCTKDYVKALEAGKPLPDIWCHGFRVPSFLWHKLHGWTWWAWHNIIMKPPVERRIHWFWSRAGSVGKSTFVKAVAQKFRDEMIILDGKAADSKYQVAQLYQKNRYPKYILQDLSRQSGNAASYKAMEDISNGCFSSSKYESCTVCECDVVPIIIIVANCPPDLNQLSQDRWKVYHICFNGASAMLQEAFIPDMEDQVDAPEPEHFVAETIHCAEGGVREQIVAAMPATPEPAPIPLSLRQVTVPSMDMEIDTDSDPDEL